IKSSLPVKQIYQEKNFANNYFQSIRIEVNDEINALKELLESLDDIMNIDAVACFISFHSLEDKIINARFKELSRNTIPKEIPVQMNNANFKIIKPKGILPSDIELDSNNRSRSAKLRVLKKIKNL
ncbi:MAG: 16S rRNA (cytosine(1402)-N(4))-methyltransferase, partial [Ureaplasma sp.]|nr:16S rRNA (cytosine(1402)-N(4))-methyltransferase [Ureaplasma sp.]